MLDDLDRLTPFEALEIISIVKSLVDLPNVIYLLSYEEMQLSRLIGEAAKTDGHRFLEKIVQYPVHLPTIDNDDLSRLLDTDLETLLPTLSEEDNIRLQYAWREALTSYVSTPRDVRRLINSFAVATAALSDFTDPVDLLILDTLRLFEPTAYQYVRRNIGDLAENDKREIEQESKAGMEERLKDGNKPNASRQALALLFPKAEQFLETAVYTGRRDSNVLRKARRICVADFAPAYFALDPQKATWGRSELDRILNQDQPDVAFRTVEERVGSALERDRSRLRRLFLDELRTTFEMSREITADWLRALLDASPFYIAAEDQTTRFLRVEDNSDRLRRLVIGALEKLSEENRSTLIASVIPEVTDLTILCTVYRSVTPDRRPEGAVSGRIVAASFGCQTDVLREQLLARIRQLVSASVIVLVASGYLALTGLPNSPNWNYTYDFVVGLPVLLTSVVVWAFPMAALWRRKTVIPAKLGDWVFLDGSSPRLPTEGTPRPSEAWVIGIVTGLVFWLLWEIVYFRLLLPVEIANKIVTAYSWLSGWGVGMSGSSNNLLLNDMLLNSAGAFQALAAATAAGRASRQSAVHGLFAASVAGGIISAGYWIFVSNGLVGTLISIETALVLIERGTVAALPAIIVVVYIRSAVRRIFPAAREPRLEEPLAVPANSLRSDSEGHSFAGSRRKARGNTSRTSMVWGLTATLCVVVAIGMGAASVRRCGQCTK